MTTHHPLDRTDRAVASPPADGLAGDGPTDLRELRRAALLALHRRVVLQRRGELRRRRPASRLLR